uniref:Uncharacterized protein n=1 Tax=Pristionchus pacificus TaxID=54126 RepID=A0A2A6C4I6_PRIPA|eukprot:PDM73008.1 hypothetical protein PRIPAC_39442 [Pristionchus pacificus]
MTVYSSERSSKPSNLFTTTVRGHLTALSIDAATTIVARIMEKRKKSSKQNGLNGLKFYTITLAPESARDDPNGYVKGSQNKSSVHSKFLIVRRLLNSKPS